MKTLFAALLLLIALPGSAPAAEVIGSGRGVSELSAASGQLVYSLRDPSSHMWRLTAQHGHTRVRLPVPAQATAFAADAGTDAAGHPVAVFPVCRVPASTTRPGSGCHLAQVRLDRPGPPTPLAATDIPGTSAVRGSEWRGALAWARHADPLPRTEALDDVLYLPDGANMPRPLPTVPVACELDCDDRGIVVSTTDLDLGAHALALEEDQVGADVVGIGDQPTLQLDPLAGGHTVISVGFVDGACGYVFPHDPTVVGTGLEWIAEGSPCDRTVTDIALLDPVGHQRRHLHDARGLTLSLTRDGHDTYWLRGHGTSCTSATSRCQIIHEHDLRLHQVSRGQALGPEPEGG